MHPELRTILVRCLPKRTNNYGRRPGIAALNPLVTQRNQYHSQSTREYKHKQTPKRNQNPTPSQPGDANNTHLTLPRATNSHRRLLRVDCSPKNTRNAHQGGIGRALEPSGQHPPPALPDEPPTLPIFGRDTVFRALFSLPSG